MTTLNIDDWLTEARAKGNTMLIVLLSLLMQFIVWKSVSGLFVIFLSPDVFFPKAVEDAFVPVIKFKFDGIEVRRT